MNSSRVILALVVGLQFGCANPKTANDANFTKAIDAYLVTNQDVYLGAGDYPHESGQWEEKLAAGGLLADTGRENIYFWGALHKKTYDLTAAGRERFTKGRGFCFGVPRVSKIMNFSAPSSMGPYTMSQVKYEWVVDDMPAWAADKTFDDLVPRGPQAAEATLILTANGWVHEKLFNAR
jgi:hypothetical protein